MRESFGYLKACFAFLSGHQAAKPFDAGYGEPMHLSEGGDPRSLLQDNACVVEFRRTGRLALDFDQRTRPDRQARAAAAALLIAHDVAPLGAADVAVTIGERLHDLVEVEIVAGTYEVADLVGERVAGGCALVVHDSESFVRVGEYPRCQSAPLGIVDD